MTLTTKNLLILEKKISTMDYRFIQKNRHRLSYHNPYFLVCINEVIFRLISNNTIKEKNLDTSDILSIINKDAEKLYLNSNISECLKI